jgi:hypothetical protein
VWCGVCGGGGGSNNRYFVCTLTINLCFPTHSLDCSTHALTNSVTPANVKTWLEFGNMGTAQPVNLFAPTGQNALSTLVAAQAVTNGGVRTPPQAPPSTPTHHHLFPSISPSPRLVVPLHRHRHLFPSISPSPRLVVPLHRHHHLFPSISPSPRLVVPPLCLLGEYLCASNHNRLGCPGQAVSAALLLPT